jgi:hypothetical protein
LFALLGFDAGSSVLAGTLFPLHDVFFYLDFFVIMVMCESATFVKTSHKIGLLI